MQKKKILTIGPVLTTPEDIASIANSLSFLNKRCIIDYMDSLSIMEDLPNPAYYTLWKKKLAQHLNDYDAFFGFSFGGVIIQQCFALFALQHKPIILFSTPTFADETLTHKLGKVIQFCKENKLEEALEALYQPVFHPNLMPPFSYEGINRERAYERLIFGLTRVLQTDSTEILKNNSIAHLHLIGEYSNLVNKKNVLPSKNGRLLVVPESSMRVLQDNPPYCQKIILEALNYETS